LLVVDEVHYTKEKSQYDGSVCAKIGALITSPRAAISKICRVIADRASAWGKNCPTGETTPRINKRAWIDLIAVAPTMRGQGLAKQMLQFCENRAMELGWLAVELSTGAANKSAISSYEKSGFVRTAGKSGKYTYTKLLRNQNS
jgi:ribosomal protein S18 acetylase RimI-like enzyme